MALIQVQYPQVSQALESIHEDRHYEAIIKLVLSEGVGQLHENLILVRDKIEKLDYSQKVYLNFKKQLKFNHNLLNFHGECLFQYLYATMIYMQVRLSILTLKFMRHCQKLGLQPTDASSYSSSQRIYGKLKLSEPRKSNDVKMYATFAHRDNSRKSSGDRDARL